MPISVSGRSRKGSQRFAVASQRRFSILARSSSSSSSPRREVWGMLGDVAATRSGDDVRGRSALGRSQSRGSEPVIFSFPPSSLRKQQTDQQASATSDYDVSTAGAVETSGSPSLPDGSGPSPTMRTHTPSLENCPDGTRDFYDLSWGRSAQPTRGGSVDASHTFLRKGNRPGNALNVHKQSGPHSLTTSVSNQQARPVDQRSTFRHADTSATNPLVSGDKLLSFLRRKFSALGGEKLHKLLSRRHSPPPVIPERSDGLDPHVGQCSRSAGDAHCDRDGRKYPAESGAALSRSSSTESSKSTSSDPSQYDPATPLQSIVASKHQKRPRHSMVSLSSTRSNSDGMILHPRMLFRQPLDKHIRPAGPKRTRSRPYMSVPASVNLGFDSHLVTMEESDFDVHSVRSGQANGPDPDVLLQPADEAQSSPELTPRMDVSRARSSVVDKKRKKSRKASMVSVTAQLNGGWPWVVCLACFVIYFVAHGTRFASGVVYQKLLQPPCPENATDTSSCGGFGASASSTAWVFSLYSGVIQGFAPVVSRIIKHAGCQVVALVGAVTLTAAYLSSSYVTLLLGLYFAYGILGGLGACMLYNAAILMIGSYFPKKRALANGIALSGAGFGGLLITYLSSLIQRQSGWQGVYRYLTASGALVILAAAVLSPRDVKPGKLYVRRHSVRRNVRVRKSTYTAHGAGGGGGGTNQVSRVSTRIRGNVELQIRALRNQKRPRMLFMMTVSFLLYDSVFFIPYFLKPEGSGVNQLYSTYITTSALGIGAIAMGLVGNRPKLNPILLQAVSFLGMGLACLLPTFTTAPATYYVFSAAYGLCNGCAWSLFLPTMVVVLGTVHLRKYIGVIFFIGMIGTVIGPPAAGAVFDSTKSYSAVYGMTLGLLVGAAILLFTVFVIWRKQHLHEKHLLKQSRLAAMMRHLSHESSVQAEVGAIPRKAKPPLLKRRSTLQTLSSLTRNALQFFDMPVLSEIIAEDYIGMAEHRQQTVGGGDVVVAGNSPSTASADCENGGSAPVATTQLPYLFTDEHGSHA